MAVVFDEKESSIRGQRHGTAADRERGFLGSIGIHYVSGSALARRCKGNLLSIGRPGGRGIVRFITGQSANVASISVHNEDVHVAVSIRAESDLLAVRRPGRATVQSIAFGKPGEISAVSANRVEFEVAISIRMEDDSTPIVRPVWSKFCLLYTSDAADDSSVV